MDIKTKILILDDCVDVLDVLTIILKDSYEVCTVTSIELLSAELMRFKPDIIILDVYIKGVAHGREICRVIKCGTETKHIPIILMSVNTKSLENFEECHADAIIEKPFDISYFLQQVKLLKERKTVAAHPCKEYRSLYTSVNSTGIMQLFPGIM